ncbi:MAG TPA: aldehyde dehydrogenase family protein [Acidobacteriota bacterium]|nr:aldehyde dehydrogenase family protein [Acidobacteriota bacterium]
MLQDKDLVSVQQARQAAQAAYEAEQVLKDFSQQQVDAVVAAMAEAARVGARRLAEMAVEETGYGKVEDKVIKNLFSAVDIHNYTKGLKTCGVIREDKERKIIEIAVPFGVVAAIIPTTNPTSTAIFKILSSIKGRNTVVVAPHPRAVRCTVETARIMYEAGLKAGLPENSVRWLEQVDLKGTTELMRHQRTGVILATGGPGLVRAAYSSGKPAYGVGSGNVPSFIERTADVPKAVRDIVAGKSFDWGVLCSSEQAIVCDRPVERQVLEELSRNNAYLLDEEETAGIETLIQKEDGSFNTEIVGQSPAKLASMAGFSVPESTSCLVGRAKGVGREHPLSREKLSPILAFFVEDGWEAGCERCIEILHYGGLGHTMSLHSNDRRVIIEFGLHKPAYRVCVNTPATHGSVGLTTSVPPSMTLGCGAPGGNITSDNITAMHLVNIKRLAFETRSAQSLDFSRSGKRSSSSPAAAPSAEAPSSGASDIDIDSVRQVVRSVVEQYLGQKKKVPAPQVTSPPSVEEAEPEPSAAAKPPAAVEFVCEDDVRQAVRNKSTIVVDQKTIITPAARDAARDQDVLKWE